MTRQRLAHSIALSTAALAALAAMAVIAGWHTASPAMVGLGFSPVAMHYNNALAVLFSALSLLAYITNRRLAARLLAIPTMLIGLAHLLQFFLKARWGLDFWFHQIIPDPNFILTLNLAPTAALALYLMGAVQISLSHRANQVVEREKLLRDVGLSVLAIASVSVWALLDSSASYGWGNLARMAPNSIAVLALLAVSGIAIPLSRESGASLSGFMQVFVRMLVPAVIASAAVFWAQLGSSEARSIREIMRQETAMTESGLQHSLESQAYSLRRMATRLGRQAEPNLAFWRADAQMYLHDHPGLIAIGFKQSNAADPEWVVKDKAPNEFLKEGINKAIEEAARAESRLAISTPSSLQDGSGQFVLVTPTSQGDDDRGAVIAIFDGGALMKGVIPAEFISQLNVVITLDSAQLFQTTAERDIFYRFWALTDTMQLLGKEWRLTIWPTPEYYRDIRANLQDIVLIAGLIIAALLMYASQLLERTALAAQSLSESQRRLQLLLDNAGEGIFGLDMNGCTTFLNSAAERITGFSASEMLHKKQHAILHHSHADGSTYPVEECNIYRVLKEGGTHFERDEVFWRKDGSCYPVEYTSSAITDEEGRVRGAVVVFRDISELIEIESKLKATNEELESFAYLASHDLKAPLRVISNAAQWLEEDLAEHLQDEDRENMELLQSRVKRMEQLLEDLLNYSRIGRVTDDRFRDKVNGKDMMDNILALLSPPEHIRVSFSDTFNQVTVARMPLQQMLYNLVANAIKHHDKDRGAINVTAKILDNEYVFTVQDDGPGIESKYHKKIFEIFRTLKPRDQVEGSGIGLSVVKKYADIYGGRIELRSSTGEGCCFTVVWPRNLSEDLST